MIEPSVHVIAAPAVGSRLADVWTTYQVTPTLKLEANAIARRFGWRFALLTILSGLLPYYSAPLGVVLFTMSLMVSASNASKIVMAKALGEDELAALTQRALAATPAWPGLLFLVMPGFFIATLGGSLLLFYPDPAEWGYYFGLGMLVYALAIFVHYPSAYFRVRREAAKKRDIALEIG